LKNTNHKTGAVILAAGESSRMKQPKALLMFNEGIRFIDKIIHEFDSFGCGEIVIVANSAIRNEIKNTDRIKVAVNEHPELGRFSSIKVGLKELRLSDSCFIHNVDNPFISSGTLKSLHKSKFENGYVYPAYSGLGGHPILICENMIRKIVSEESNDLNFRDYLSDFNSKEIDVKDVAVTVNINTISDYVQYFNR